MSHSLLISRRMSESIAAALRMVFAFNIASFISDSQDTGESLRLHLQMGHNTE